MSGSLINESIDTITNILLFSLIPFVWYLFRKRTLQGFTRSLGIYRPPQKGLLAVLLAVTTVYSVTLVANVVVIVSGNSGRSPVDTQGLTVSTLFLYLLLYGMKTGIAEEILFRGFIAKKLIGILGFPRGNGVQAVVFALPHYVIADSASAIDIIVRIVNAFLLGYTFGYVMVRHCNGSILPVMLAHILFNMASSYVLSMLL